MLALVAGEGRLPLVVYEIASPVIVCELEGHASGLPNPIHFRIETLGSLMGDLRDRGVAEVCFAGRVRRPALDPDQIDSATAPLIPHLAGAMEEGDDGALRTLVSLFEEAGIRVRGPQELVPHLLPQEGIPTTAKPSDQCRRDTARAAQIHERLGDADIGQALVVAGAQALAVEALGGTDWMLATLAHDRPEGPSGGVLYKAPKPRQDRRIDLPTIGPDTPAKAAAAGLRGIAVEAGGVLVVDYHDTVAECDANGLFLWVRTP